MQIVEGIAIIDNAFSEDYCNYLISFFENNEQLHYVGATMSGTNPEWKKTIEVNLLGNIQFVDFAEVLNKNLTNYLEEYSIDVDNWDLYSLFSVTTNYRHCKLQKYIKNDGHYTALHQEREAQELGKDRVFVFMLYLNDVGSGGKTDFPLQKIELMPKCGTLVIWPAGFPYLHRGEMPISNDKYIVTTWLEYIYEDEDDE